MASAGARKIVTILFADLVGSTGLHERLDPESARRFVESYYAAAREAVESQGGRVTQFLGDGVKAVFGIPRVAEDDAIRAVRAGVAMQEAFRALAEQQRGAVGETGLRVAVNTGEVVAKGETEIIGDPVNVAARLQERGRDGDVVIGESTQRLVASQISLELLGSFDLKGRAEAVKAYRVVSLDAPRRAAATAFVGREEELARIKAVYDLAVATPGTRLAVLLGSPGLGKSRLIGEFARRIDGAATVVAAHCDAAGGATFAPLAEALREFLAGGEDGAHLPVLNRTVDFLHDSPSRRRQTTAAPQGERKKSFEMNTNTDRAEEAALLSGRLQAPSAHLSTVRTKEREKDGTLRAAIEAAIPGENTERARIANGIMGILAGAPGAPEETFFVVRRFLAGLARKQPVVLMIDDLQWAEPLLLDLVEHLVQWGRGLPLLVLIGARPELREVRSSFAIPGGLVTDVVTLASLDAGIAMRLAASVIGATDLPAAVAAKVLATSEGNPLFIGELVRMLVDEGALIRDGNRWKTGEALATVEMPPTIHALLAARIERLEPQQCAVLERAAVVGRQFSRSAVAGLLPNDGAGLDAQLESLQRAQLIERDTGWLLGDPVLRFHHVLIRDAAYRRLLKGTRAELHERLANWIEERVGDAPEHDETIGRHLEEAHRLLGELGPIDDTGQLLGERAATRLAAAGRRALEVDDVPLAAGLLGRALDRLKADDPARADLALDWCEALLTAGDVTTAATAIDQLGRFAHGSLPFSKGGQEGFVADSDQIPLNPPLKKGEAVSNLATNNPTTNNLSSRLQAWHTCFVGHHTVLTAPQELSATVDLVAAAATSLASLDDAAGEAKAHFVHALALSRLGRVGACEASLDQALAAARRAGDRRRANTVLAIAPLAALWGPSPVTRASGRCLDVVRVLRITHGAPAVEAVALSCQGVLEALRGRTEAAHRMIASGRKMVEELGIAQRLFETDVFAGFVALLEGDAAAAEQTLRGAYDGLRDLGLGIDAARAAALLARALLAQDRIDEAEALSHESEALAGDDLKAAIAWRGVRAEALARHGEHSAAIELAKAGVEIAAATDALLDHADARLALAAALRAAGRGAEADAEERHAIVLWEAKGAMLLAERVQQRATKLVRPDRGVDSPAVKPPPAPTLVQTVDCSSRRRQASAAPQSERKISSEINHIAARAKEAAFPSRLEAQSARLSTRSGKEGGPERRVRQNAASTLMKGIEAGFAARDQSAIEALLSDRLHTVEHPTGATYEREGQLESIERMLRLPNLEFRIELLATLGEALCLGRRRVTASGTAGGRFDVAEFEMDHIVLSEVDELGRLRLSEVFAADHLGDAIHRLYERLAELLPEGPARESAATAARVIRMSLTPFNVAPEESLVDPGIEIVDHRNLGSWNAVGAGAVMQHMAALHDVARDAVVLNLDILALEPTALLVQRLHSGTERAGGGIYERQYYILGALGPDGRLKRVEFFDLRDEARALTRFDQLTAGAAEQHATQRPSRRAVRANAATRISEGFERTINARDPTALEHWLADDLQFEHWPTGASYGAREFMATWRGAFKAKHLEFELEVMASLGDCMAVHRHQVTVEGVRDSAMADFGRAELDEIVVVEADESGKCRRMDLYAAEKLGDAVARLYERHAELLETGPAHERAATTARTVATMVTRSTDHKAEDVMASNLQFFDHGTVGQISARGYDLVSRFLEAWEELTDDRTIRVEDVLGLTGNAFLRRSTISGTVRASGGPFESSFLVLSVFGPDGRQSRTETFQVGHEAEALARFDEIAGIPREGEAPAETGVRRGGSAGASPSPADRGVSNDSAREFDSLAAQGHDRFGAMADWRSKPARVWNRADTYRDLVVDAWHARDWPAIEGLLHENFRFSDRRPMIRLELDRDGWIDMSRRLGNMDSSRLSVETVATRGERLVLWRVRIEVAGGDVGPSLVEHLNLFEANEACDRLVWAARFEVADVADAYAELDARYEAGEAATPSNNLLSISGFVRAVERRDWDAVRALCRDDFVEHDHRGLAVLGGTEGADAWVDNFRTLVELAPDTVYRAHHVLEAERGYFVHGSWYGTREGGPYELQVNAVLELDDVGRFRRADMYDDAVADAALTRLAELGVNRPPLPRPVLSKVEGGDHRGVDAEPPPNPLLLKEGETREQRFANAATRAVDRGTTALAARDWEAFAALMAPGFRHYDRTRIAQLETDGREWLDSTRRIVEMTSGTPVYQVLATRGERLALFEMLWRGAKGDVGASEIEQRLIVEANEHEEHAAIVFYDPEDTDAAYAELDARFEAEQGDRLPASWTLLRQWVRAVAERDWEAVASLCADDLVEYDNRSLSVLGVTQGVEPWIQIIRTVIDLAPDSVFRINHFIPGARGCYQEGGYYGTREGGPFEILGKALVEIDDHGLLARVDIYDDDRVFASSRWAELGIPVPPAARESAALDDPRPTVAEPNAASAAVDRWLETYRNGAETGNWEPMREVCAPGFEYVDRRRMVLLEGDVELLLASVRERAATGARIDLTPVGTAGDRIDIRRVLWSGGPADGRFEIEYLAVSAVDESGLIAAFVLFDLDDARAAQREAWARWSAIDPDAAAVATPVGNVQDAFNEKSAAKWRAAFADDLVVEDHRLAGMGRIEGADAYTESVVALWKLAPVTHGEMGWWWPALDRHGAITVVRRTGAVPDGGGDFESEYLYLYLVAQERITRIETFEMDALDRALARFEELRPVSASDPLRIPPNQAIRATGHLDQAFLADDLPRVRALFHPQFAFEDRGKKALVKGDVETLIESAQYLLSLPHVRLDLPLLGTMGDRIALHHELWSGGADRDAFALDRIRLAEIDANGLFRTWVLFDSEDRDAAFAEAQERFVAGEAAGCGAQALLNTLHIAWGNQDWEALRSLIADDAVIDDYRQLGLGQLGRDGWIESWRVGADLAPDVRLEVLRILVWNEHGRVQLSRAYGTRDGGEFENVLLNVFVQDGGLLRYQEFFDVGDAERAVARFEELCAALKP